MPVFTLTWNLETSRYFFTSCFHPIPSAPTLSKAWISDARKAASARYPQTARILNACQSQMQSLYSPCVLSVCDAPISARQWGIQLYGVLRNPAQRVCLLIAPTSIDHVLGHGHISAVQAACGLSGTGATGCLQSCASCKGFWRSRRSRRCLAPPWQKRMVGAGPQSGVRWVVRT